MNIRSLAILAPFTVSLILAGCAMENDNDYQYGYGRLDAVRQCAASKGVQLPPAGGWRETHETHAANVCGGGTYTNMCNCGGYYYGDPASTPPGWRLSPDQRAAVDDCYRENGLTPPKPMYDGPYHESRRPGYPMTPPAPPTPLYQTE
jgi:hypothetical protein